MFIVLEYAFLFFVGSLTGWVLELFFRRFAHGKWVNPGFLIGPCLPIYGFGLCGLHFIYMMVTKFNINNPILAIVLMGIMMTLIEFIGGLSFLKAGKVKLWDYSDMWGNYKGIICPQFSLIWTGLGAIYYFFLADYYLKLLNWFSTNLWFSFIVGFFYGIFVIDLAYSTKLLIKIRKYAKENKAVAKYEELKLKLKKFTDEAKEKYSFWFPFRNLEKINVDKLFNKHSNKFLKLFKKDKKDSKEKN